MVQLYSSLHAASDLRKPSKPKPAPTAEILPQPSLIRVDGVEIDRRAIELEMQNHPAASPAEAWQSSARALVIRQLLLREAHARGIATAPASDGEGRRETDEEALVRALIARDVTVPTATDEECRRFYDLNRSRFRSPSIIEARHILLAADPNDPRAREQARAEAEAIVATLKHAPDRFAALAAGRSACPSAREAGNLGQITPGSTVPEFEAALDRAPGLGLMPEPVETRYGFHVVSIDRRIKGNDVPFAVVKDRIAGWLEERARRVGISHYTAELARRSVIEGVSLEDQVAPGGQ